MVLRFLLALMLFAAALVIASAEDITTLDGKTYKNVTVRRADAVGIDVVHSTGAARLRFDNLPAEIQARYHYDGERAAEAKSAEEQKKREELERRAAAEKEQREFQARADAYKAEVARVKADEAAKKMQAEKEAQAKRDRAKHNAEMMNLAGGILALIIGVVIYFLPTIVGARKINAGAIFVLNAAAGWTFVGWVIALVWACTKEPHEIAEIEARRKA